MLNPVRAGICTAAAEWRWSSCAAVMGNATPLPGLQVEKTLALFGAQSGPAHRAFSRFVADGVGAFEPHEHVARQVFLGDEYFVACVTRQAAQPSREVPKKQRVWTSVAQIACQSPDRNAAIRAA